MKIKKIKSMQLYKEVSMNLDGLVIEIKILIDTFFNIHV